ncbi:von Willebrand factor A domain-containing protein 8 isoform X2 [Ciona intestinalis]
MLRILMKTEKSVRRINHLRAVLNKDNQHVTCSRHKHDGYVSIGNVKVPVKTPQNPELVPYAYVVENKELPQSILRHMKWMAQKDLLGQDVFLIGPPGPLRRLIAMQYLELTRKEVEYISLSRDTTESDLKQRREMKQGTSFYIDQCAVRAAVEGRVLIIEGVEKAERNVLPALNNLLENREMQLDDGRFLMHHKRYDQLLQDHSKETLDDWQLVRVSENFRVFALGLPVPKYRGHPLDPPLRSRFQARDVYHLGFSDQLEELYKTAPSVNETLLAETLSCASALVTQDSANLGLPHFPLDNLIKAAKIMEKKFDISSNSSVDSLVLKDIHHKNNQAAVTLASNQQTHSFEVSCGDHIHGPRSSVKDEFVATPYHQRLLADLMLSHSAMDVCIVGGKGCGKSSVIREFSRLLNYRTEPVLMYQDMTARDLLQQRYTLPNGDTVWKLSPLIEAAMEGGMAVLDGLNRVNPGTLSILQRLVHDREVTLHDGTRLIRHDKFDGMKEKLNLTDQEMNEKSVYRIHPSFRMVGVAEPPAQGSSQQWLNPELLTLFLYHHMEPLSINNEMEIIQKLVPDVSLTEIKGLLKLCQKLRSAKDANSVSLAASLSTRQLVRISKRLVVSQHNVNRSELVSDAVHKACLSRFLPQLARSALCGALEKSGLPPDPFPVQDLTMNDISCEIKDGILKIGEVSSPVYTGGNVEAESSVAKVPDVLFYDNAQHLSVMRDMLQDYNLGEHILLVGNQGVGKNKIVDRFLHLLNKPREYLQLHRDTTVQSLTVQPTVRDGIIVYEDSALVRAARLGHALVVDEADKAPTHVTCILKALLESGRATLADGRKIVTDPSELDHLSSSTSNKEVILLHPDFRMFVLANRPGFPFLGNDFFGAVGDVFSCHAVDNPSVSSELDMLRQYGENVPEASLNKLVAAFGELRNLADRGLISYPYSTREVVNIVKHLEKFPKEGLANVVRNVFDFDAYSKETKEQLASVMHKHGIPVGAKPHDVRLAKPLPLSVPKLSGYWNLLHQSSSQCEVESFEMSVKGPVHLNVQNYDIDRTEDRGLDFSEQFAHWQLPQFFRTNIITDIAISKNGPVDTVNIFAVNGSALYVNQRGSSVVKYIDMYDVFPNVGSMSHASVKIAPLGSSLQGQLLLFEQKSKFLLMIDTNSGATRRLFIPGMEGTSDPHLSMRRSSSTPATPPYKMCSEFSEEFCSVVFFEENGHQIFHLNAIDGQVHGVKVDFKIQDVQLVAHDKWLITEADTNIKYMLSTKSIEDNIPNKLTQIKEEGVNMGFGSYSDSTPSSLITASTASLSSTQLTTSLKQAVDSPNRVLVDKNSYAKCVVGFPDLTATNEIYTFPRSNDNTDESLLDKGRTIYRGMTKYVPPKPPCQILSDSNQVVKIVPLKSVPDTAFNEGVKPSLTTHCMEVADLGQHMLRYVPLPQAVSESPYVSWQSSISESGYNTAVGKNDVLYTVDAGGCVREWETGLMNLKRSLDEWRAMIGSDGGDDRLQITTERESGEDVTAPKHGKIDPDNAPHVGGNTWAGGTGGRDTAGLGGKGGPYRLDMGHDVTQVPDWEKEAVPEHVKKAARDVAKKAFKERLREIRMSEFDADMYEKFSSHVRKQVKSLRIILDSLQAKGKERQWLKHQTTGELDDMKLIEGLTGEKNIYKRRAEQEPEPGTPQQKPKRIRVVMDVSGSMYRFNGLDNRLERTVEAACLVMESFEGYKDKFKYELWGHSGDGFEIPLVTYEKPPANNKERLDVMKTMHAHAQFCMSGDYTLEATEYAIKNIKEQEADEHFVIVLSDANLERYGIRPSQFAEALTSDDEVNAFAIFIGSLGDQAERLKRQLPLGRSFVCMDTKNIPQILQQIFTSTLLK